MKELNKAAVEVKPLCLLNTIAETGCQVYLQLPELQLMYKMKDVLLFFFVLVSNFRGEKLFSFAAASFPVGLTTFLFYIFGDIMTYMLLWLKPRMCSTEV